MRIFIVMLFIAQLGFFQAENLLAQSDPILKEFGISAGGFTNFPANQNYLTENMGAFYVAPYVRVGKHEFSAGLLLPLQTQALANNSANISPRPGGIAGYKFYIFNVEGRENMFIHYAFQYLRFSGTYDSNFQQGRWTETDMYINNVIGLGYNLFFDTNERFGLYYTLDYVISQTGYKTDTPRSGNHQWMTDYVWNNISTHFGFIFKLTSLNKKVKK